MKKILLSLLVVCVVAAGSAYAADKAFSGKLRAISIVEKYFTVEGNGGKLYKFVTDKDTKYKTDETYIDVNTFMGLGMGIGVDITYSTEGGVNLAKEVKAYKQ